MLVEFLHQMFVVCPLWARRLGLAYEHVAIASRRRRVGSAWDAHLTASRENILAGAARCRTKRRALIIGAGDCFDIPVAELAAQFEEVVLADIVIGLAARRWARRHPGRVKWAVWDATGALQSLAAERERITASDAIRRLTETDPGPPPGGTPDLVVSANCLSQLGLVPAHHLRSTREDENLREKCVAAAARRHLAWLAAQSWMRVLLADVARIDLAPDGRELKREPMLAGQGLRAPGRTWRWNLAPIPEWSRDFHRVHEVGAWIDGPRTLRGS